MKTRLIALAALALVTLTAPLSGRVDAASGVKTLGCPQYGYTLLVPTAWKVYANCSKAMSVDGSANGIAFILSVDPHAFWNDQRSAATFQTDLVQRAINAGTTITQGLETGHAVVDGRRFATGLLDSRDSVDGDYLRTEVITYAGGDTYRLMALVALDDTKATVRARTGLYEAILLSLTITGPQ